ncbi:hypothetical protein [Candidatus Cyanaurora vandensis]|uniref:hypothetical protein n=1 Tax=Candidatus Cyanaurora vandensis TaxID=2714958 RepID=UPI0025795D79|nr:hypothetical protein [Candidatus Cyanaurora vandensis]
MYQAFAADDLFYDAAEGPAQLRQADSYDDDEFLGGVLNTLSRGTGGPLGATEDAGDEDQLEAELADALDAEDTDEFLRRLRRIGRGVANVARRVGRGVGQAARVIGPVASLIPIPQAQLIGRLANVAGRLLADGADEFEALDEMLEMALAEDVDLAAPLLSVITIRKVLPNASRLPQQNRRQLVQSVSQATRTLARRQGPQAARAVTRIVQGVQQTARQQRVPIQQLPRAIQRAASRVAQNPTLVRRLAQSPERTRGSGSCPNCGIRPNYGTQQYNLQGPVQLTIRERQ